MEQACVAETFTEPLERLSVEHMDEVLPSWNLYLRRGYGQEANKPSTQAEEFKGGNQNRVMRPLLYSD